LSLLKERNSLTNLPSAVLLNCSRLLGAQLHTSGLEGRESLAQGVTFSLQMVQFWCTWTEVEQL